MKPAKSLAKLVANHKIQYILHTYNTNTSCFKNFLRRKKTGFSSLTFQGLEPSTSP